MKLFLVLCGLLLVAGCTFQSGQSNDRIYGYDKGIIWNHLYLVNDHSTAYCFDDGFVPSVQKALAENRSVVVHYEKYLVRGSLCSVPENMEAVVVTEID